MSEDALANVKSLYKKPIEKFLEGDCVQYVLIDKAVPDLLMVDVFCIDPQSQDLYPQGLVQCL